jgi:ABC-2 type transport system permease protein
MRALSSIYRLGMKELWSLWRDPVMLVLIVFTFTGVVYTSAKAMPESLHMASIAIVDEDRSPLSQRIVDAFYPPQFAPPVLIDSTQIDPGLDAGRYTFVLRIPANFQRDVVRGRGPELQLNTDATRMTQAFTGSNYIQQIALGEVNSFVARQQGQTSLPVDIELRARYNPTLNATWFGALVQVIDQITLLAILLTGAALIREREHGTIEHLLVMPVTPFEIMASKVWSMSLVVLIGSFLSIQLVVRGLLHVPITGSLPLFFAGAILAMFATTSIGIFMATVARNMPQFGMLAVLVLIPLQMLSGGITPRESMPQIVQNVMLAAPTTHFISLGQAILFRGAGLEVVWPQMIALVVIGAFFFVVALRRFRAVITQMA